MSASAEKAQRERSYRASDCCSRHLTGLALSRITGNNENFRRRKPHICRVWVFFLFYLFILFFIFLAAPSIHRQSAEVAGERMNRV